MFLKLFDKLMIFQGPWTELKAFRGIESLTADLRIVKNFDLTNLYCVLSVMEKNFA